MIPVTGGASESAADIALQPAWNAPALPAAGATIPLGQTVGGLAR